MILYAQVRSITYNEGICEPVSEGECDVAEFIDRNRKFHCFESGGTTRDITLVNEAELGHLGASSHEEGAHEEHDGDVGKEGGCLGPTRRPALDIEKANGHEEEGSLSAVSDTGENGTLEPCSLTEEVEGALADGLPVRVVRHG